jgi:hypothetical protein
MNTKIYLGDGLYVDYDGYQFELYTDREDGRHTVYLDPDVLERFISYTKTMFDNQVRASLDPT